MAVSKRPSCKSVHLGIFGPIIRRRLINKNPGPKATLPITFLRFTDPIGSGSYSEARRVKHLGVNTYQVGLPSYIVTIKVDRKPVPVPLGSQTLGPNEPLTIQLRRLDMEPAWPQALDLIKKL